MLKKDSQATIPSAVRDFSKLDDDVLVSLNTASRILDRSRASLYRDEAAGKLKLIKVGSSRKARVGELRKLMGVVA